MTDQSSTKGMRTKAVHAGEGADPVTGASSPNLVMSSTFVVHEPLSFSARNMREDMPYLYTRWANPTVRQLEDKLAALEGAEACVALGSGMAATAAVLLGTLSQGDHLVVSDINYAGTAELARDTLPRFGIEVTPVDTSEADNIARAMRPNTRIVWVETPANPIMRLTDIAAAAQVAHAADARLVVDSTFATPIATRPLELGADLVVHSLTKYIGGHGDAVGGAVLGNAQALSAVNVEARIHHGGVLSPFNAWLIMRGAATLPLRMRAHQENALALARFLEAHPRVERVLYPGLPSHPQHELAVRQMDNFSGMIAVRVKAGAALAERMMRELRVFHYAVSLGHHRSLIYWMDTRDLTGSSFRLSGAALESYRRDAGDGVFRISVGVEDVEDLRADLARVLD
ncbi:MAG: aminotransferase class I/II-fold pyridoxal phosphate-dependent enzyme [Gammaproteobacteria bacterium]|nr:aminotransferase class I/II-fold pyridoxal phosphate-dependent enzyme [Gammaproteobacteria bacterium]NIR81626.1 aminotransferase class I/II-fold pyridoxal phosphate-dependent enzyme [Gammaproteobacteria bacterium]NIR88177.1 aminotransferase class I/II-fold pyridoxal phosphate-dependent enzyme [Gammaproteobacteria bacterium]NIU02738.1 aminotransferase class I/II-fold pyridoxal phosphate-dependent enzyme [Gammaproteobacteria bacterium]NIV73337.1 aminotransferase class V-fold PLP-dependent enzy